MRISEMKSLQHSLYVCIFCQALAGRNLPTSSSTNNLATHELRDPNFELCDENDYIRHFRRDSDQTEARSINPLRFVSRFIDSVR